MVTICVAPVGLIGSMFLGLCSGIIVPIGLALFFAEGMDDGSVGPPMAPQPERSAGEPNSRRRWMKQC
ncbi:hypothetical protein [Sphingobacterium faecale]|uniref:AI-2E family transporter n=1 Tax=Sphingobacterium faecale TaxID=2803775 RepID=A0ABS1R284_9SPHI|nr:hypothetical protein [Sphingobacterium faecale]MBL1408812.1 hypothetical protein [Sphingobacterium faecale]